MFLHGWHGPHRLGHAGALLLPSRLLGSLGRFAGAWPLRWQAAGEHTGAWRPHPDLIEASGAKDVRLVGHSMGALIRLRSRARRPSGQGRSAAWRGAGDESASRSPLGGPGGQARGDRDRRRWGVGRRAQMGGHRAPGNWVAGASLRLLEQRAVPVLGIDFAACDAWDGALTAATNVRCPTLVLSGADDRMTPPKLARPLISAIDGAAVTLARAGHMMMVEQPDETLDALAAFIDGVPA